MTTIGFIGSGRVGGALAQLAVAAGHDVVLSNSRGPHNLREIVAWLGSQANAASTTEAASAGDLVVVTIPIRAYRQVPVAPLRGRVVIDTLNYDRHARAPSLRSRPATSRRTCCCRHTSTQRVRGQGVQHRVLPALPQLARRAGAPDRSAIPVAGDQAPAKTAVAALIDSLGFDAHDVGRSPRAAGSRPAPPHHWPISIPTACSPHPLAQLPPPIWPRFSTRRNDHEGSRAPKPMPGGPAPTSCED